MQLSAVSPTPAAAPAAATANLGQKSVADTLRAAGAGYDASARGAGVTVDKATITPFEGVITLTSALKNGTANIPGVGKVTSLLNTVAGFGMLIAASTVSSSLKAQANTTNALLNMAADAIDGGSTIATTHPAGSIGSAVAEALAEAERRSAAAK